MRDLVLREERPVAALRHGYRMFRAHLLGPALLTWLIQLGVSIGATIVVVIVGLVLAVVVAVPTIALFAADLVTAAIAVLDWPR